MIVSNQKRIVREIRIDDGTTGGKTVFIDNYGGKWVRTTRSQESAGTGDVIVTIDSNGNMTAPCG